MDKKQKAISQIVTIMWKEGISLDEISLHLMPESPQEPQEFDLLCEVEKVKIRVPIEQGKFLNPIGIFPFTSNFWLSLKETDVKVSRKFINESAIPSIKIFEEIFALKDRLNAVLNILKAPVLEGNYFAQGQDLNWVVRFGDNQSKFDCAYYNDEYTAKVRYCGQYQP
ncbi:MAG: hypothetical protein IJ689_03890 [Alphaproteobacteria bacterium]|nr:hypothetical protein [Alphaproteobacteria bacterium]